MPKDRALSDTRVLRCPACGFTMQKTNKRGKPGMFYGCTSRTYGSIECGRWGKRRWNRKRRKMIQEERCTFGIEGPSRASAIEEWNRLSREKWGVQAGDSKGR